MLPSVVGGPAVPWASGPFPCSSFLCGAPPGRLGLKGSAARSKFWRARFGSKRYPVSIWNGDRKCREIIRQCLNLLCENAQSLRFSFELVLRPSAVDSRIPHPALNRDRAIGIWIKERMCKAVSVPAIGNLSWRLSPLVARAPPTATPPLRREPR